MQQGQIRSNALVGFNVDLVTRLAFDPIHWKAKVPTFRSIATSPGRTHLLSQRNHLLLIKYKSEYIHTAAMCVRVRSLYNKCQRKENEDNILGDNEPTWDQGDLRQNKLFSFWEKESSLLLIIFTNTLEFEKSCFYFKL